ncbi:MAG: hypothetical protein R3C59_21145 [Planctomycetaceae bacterium]
MSKTAIANAQNEVVKQAIDTDWLSIHGCEGYAVPFSCRYHGNGLPDEGVLPTDFSWDDFGDEEE